MGGACIQNSDSEETGQGQTINSYTNKPIGKFKVYALLDAALSCTHRVWVGPDNFIVLFKFTMSSVSYSM